MTSKQKLTLYLFIIFALMSFYSYGTAMMDYFLVYPSRYIVGESEFIEYHKLLEKAIWPISVAPFLFIIVMNIVMVWLRPDAVSRKLVFLSLICLVLDFLSTVFMQAPWNYQLLWEGKNVELMQKITDTNWIRVFLESAQALTVFFMMKEFAFEKTLGRDTN